MKKISIISKIAMLAILLVLIFGVSSFATTVTARRIKYSVSRGDVNRDGKVTREDANKVLRFSAKLEKLSMEEQYI